MAEKVGNEEKVSIRVTANTNFFMPTKIYLNSKGRKESMDYLTFKRLDLSRFPASSTSLSRTEV